MNALNLLRADHDRLRQILPKLYDESIAADERARYVEAVAQELKMHAMVEEEIFYPAYKDAARTREDRDMYYESIEEHHVVDMLLPELTAMKDATTDGFRAKAKVLRELIEHHAGEEEEDLFPKAQELLGDALLNDLGERIAKRKDELEQQWSTTVGAMLRKAQSVAEKFAPTSMKDARVDARRE